MKKLEQGEARELCYLIPSLSSITRGSHCPNLQMRKLSLGEVGPLAW